MLCGVCMYFCVVICEMVDLCMFIVLVMLCRISGFMVFLLQLRKLCWCLMIWVVIFISVLLWFCRFLMNQWVFCNWLCMKVLLVLLLVWWIMLVQVVLMCRCGIVFWFSLISQCLLFLCMMMLGMMYLVLFDLICELGWGCRYWISLMIWCSLFFLSFMCCINWLQLWLLSRLRQLDIRCSVLFSQGVVDGNWCSCSSRYLCRLWVLMLVGFSCWMWCSMIFILLSLMFSFGLMVVRIFSRDFLRQLLLLMLLMMVIVII